jgi:hypothetical protein
VAEQILGEAHSMVRFIQVVQDLLMARDLGTITSIVRRAARELTGADRASLVLRASDACYCADGDTDEPAPSGQGFAMERCVSSWAMCHREPVVLEDVSSDVRVVAEIEQARLVKSLIIVPIRRGSPIGAIGSYWAVSHHPSDAELSMLHALADSTSVAMANVEFVADLEARVAERTAQLDAANREIEAFAYAVSHDLRAPLRAIKGFSQVLIEDHASELAEGKRHLERICAATTRMATLIDDLSQLSKVARGDLVRAAFDAAPLARDIIAELRRADPDREVEVAIPAALPIHGDHRLVRIVFDCLLRNAWKFTSKRAAARIELGSRDRTLFVRDNGAGFDVARAAKLFLPFQRMHTAAEFEGSGIGLAVAQRVVRRHGGRIWAATALDQGATFFFTLE